MTTRPDATQDAPRWQILVSPELHPYWRDALRRSGLPTASLDDVTPAQAAASVLALPDTSHHPSPTLRRQIRVLMDAGVPVVACADAAAALQGHREAKTRRVLGVSQVTPLLAADDLVRLDSEVRVPPYAALGTCWPSRDAAVAWSLAGARCVVALPLPDADAAMATGGKRQAFALDDQRTAFEFASRCDHGAVRRLLVGALRWVAHRRGLPFAYLGPAPGLALGTFALRIDADDFDANATETLLQRLTAVDARATWFIDVERHANKGGAPWIQRMLDAGQDVQSHGYHHYTYSRTDRNLDNFARSVALLRQWGAAPNAAAAPFGSWNHGLQAAFAELGFIYSSEFGRIHDDHPALLPTADVPPLWQVPVHPVCPAIAREAGLTPAEISAYLAGVVRTKLARGEPAIVYGHPIRDLDGCPNLLTTLAATLADHERAGGGTIWRATLGEVLAFYRERANQEIECRWHQRHLEVDSGDGPAAVWVEAPGAPVERVRGRAVIPADTATDAPTDAPTDAAAAVPELACRRHCDVVAPLGWEPHVRQRTARVAARIRLARMWREVKTARRSAPSTSPSSRWRRTVDHKT
ncbi:MAG: polysaccharide deacetylase family protein [Planctomycetota bacterium]